MSYGYAPFNGKAELTVPDNWMHFADYRNVGVDELIGSIDQALDRGFSIAVDIDVSEPGFKTGKGVAKLPEDLEKPGAVTSAHGVARGAPS